MKIVKFETWWVKRNKCLFDEKRKGKSSMDWDVVVLKLTTDNGYEGIATALAARSGRVTESYLHDNIAPVVLPDGHLIPGSNTELFAYYGMDGAGIAETVKKTLTEG